MDNGNKKKADQLGMPHGTASNRLRKQVLFSLIKRLDEHYCYQCGAEITSVEELSMEHKTPWLDNSPDLFWDLNNIAFSHPSCNYGAARKIKAIHPSTSTYRNGCRCDGCKRITSDTRKARRIELKEQHEEHHRRDS